MHKLEEIKTYFKSIIAEELNISISSIKDDDTFFDLGLDSINAVFLLEVVEQHYKITLSPLDFWDYPTIGAFTKKVYQDHFRK